MPTCKYQDQVLKLAQISHNKWTVKLANCQDLYCNALTLEPGSMLVLEDRILLVQTFQPSRTRGGPMIRSGTITTEP